MIDPLPSILVVDDDWLILDLIKASLSSAPFDAQYFQRGPTALAAARLREARGMKFDLLLADCRMPEMSGQELASLFSSRYPETKILLMSGEPIEPLNLPSLVGYLQKPLRPSDLRTRILEALNQP